MNWLLWVALYGVMCGVGLLSFRIVRSADLIDMDDEFANACLAALSTFAWPLFIPMWVTLWGGSLAWNYLRECLNDRLDEDSERPE